MPIGSQSDEVLEIDKLNCELLLTGELYKDSLSVSLCNQQLANVHRNSENFVGLIYIYIYIYIYILF